MPVLKFDNPEIDYKRKENVCPICPLVFSTKGSLKRHRIESHDKKKDYQCIQCQRRFTRKNHLSRHMKIHINIKKINT
jgi:uncharacterized Zn-finger protein